MIAICMIAWNEIQSTRRTVESILNHSAPHDIKFFFLDNGSTDDGQTSEYMRSKNPAAFFRADSNESIYKGWNRVAAAALEHNPDGICIISNDVQVGPHWLDPVVREIGKPEKRYFLPNGFPSPEDLDIKILAALPSLAGQMVHGRSAWCMFFSPDAVRAFLPIPEELRLWFGDDWIHERLIRSGYAGTTLLDCCAYHFTSTTFYRTPSYVEIVAQDRAEFEKIKAREGWILSDR